MKFSYLLLILLFMSCSTDSPQANKSVEKILKVQEHLRNKGYEVPLSGKPDSATRRAFLTFQRDNNLPSCPPSATLDRLFEDRHAEGQADMLKIR